MITAEDVAKALDEGAQLGNDGWWTCRCPAHDDSTPSLGIKETPFGKGFPPSVNCFAGCTRDCAER